MNTNPPTTTPSPGRLLRLPGIEALTGLKKSTIYTHMANKDDPFPAPVRIGARAVAWRESDWPMNKARPGQPVTAHHGPGCLGGCYSCLLVNWVWPITWPKA